MPGPFTSDIRFTWIANNPVANLSSFKLYAGRVSGIYAAVGSPKTIADPAATTGTFTINDNGLWYFALTAVGTSGLESEKSNEVSRSWLLLGNF